MLGGNMRQAGPLAAAGIVALETMVTWLEHDHETAQRLAQKLHHIDPRVVDPADVETNIVKAELPKDRQTAAEWSAVLRGHGILVSPSARYTLRFVTHRHISEADIDEAVSAFAAVYEKSSTTVDQRDLQNPTKKLFQ
jgi:threonine aldolase